MAPEMVIPIHSFHPDKFKDYFPNVRLVNDGEVVNLWKLKILRFKLKRKKLMTKAELNENMAKDAKISKAAANAGIEGGRATGTSWYNI